MTISISTFCLCFLHFLLSFQRSSDFLFPSCLPRNVTSLPVSTWLHFLSAPPPSPLSAPGLISSTWPSWTWPFLLRRRLRMVWWRISGLRTASVRIPVFCCLTCAHLFSAAAESNHKTQPNTKPRSIVGGAPSGVAPDVSINLWHNIVSNVNAASVESHFILYFFFQVS